MVFISNKNEKKLLDMNAKKQLKKYKKSRVTAY